MIVKYLLVGLLQGVLEWLPISSQGNLVLVMVYLFGFKAGEALPISIYLHTGTLLAVLFYFRNYFYRLIVHLPKYRPCFSGFENRLVSFLLLATILTAIVGYPIFRIALLSTFHGEIFIALVGVALISTGLLQKSAPMGGMKRISALGVGDALLLGVLQGFSAFPGVSRSGVTTSALLMRKFEGEEALRLSFLMSAPAVLVAELGLIITEGLPPIDPVSVLVGLGGAFLGGVITIHGMIKVAKKIKFWGICILLGILSLLPLLSYL